MKFLILYRGRKIVKGDHLRTAFLFSWDFDVLLLVKVLLTALSFLCPALTMVLKNECGGNLQFRLINILNIRTKGRIFGAILSQ